MRITVSGEQRTQTSVYCNRETEQFINDRIGTRLALPESRVLDPNSLKTNTPPSSDKIN